MAKIKTPKHEGKSVKVTTKTFYGTSSSDVIRDLDDGRVLCKDDIGEYITTKDRVDNGLANPHRWDRGAQLNEQED